MTKEMIQKATECKSAEDLLALARENGMEMTAEDAAKRFAELHNDGELSDDELDSASGGGCGECAETDTTVVLKDRGCPSCGEKTAVYYRRIPVDSAPNIYQFRCSGCMTEFTYQAKELSNLI